MLATLAIIALVSFVTILAVAIVRRALVNKARFSEVLAIPNQDLGSDRLRSNVYSTWIFERVFGVFFAVGTSFGNCFSPAIVLNWYGRCKPVSSHRGPTGERLAKVSEKHKEWILARFQEKLVSPELWSYPAWACLTLRWGHAETRVYYRGWFRFDWSSEHVARRWGQISEQDHGTCYQYKGWLGQHDLV